MTNAPVPADRPRHSRRGLMVAGGLMACWIVALLVMALTDDNPVVNQRQIRRADLVVTAVIDDPDAGNAHVREVLYGDARPDDALTIPNLKESGAARGETYIVPLWRSGRVVKVSDPRDPGSGRPVIYPASQNALAQVRAALAAGRIDE